jgi:hypothetical protein
MATTTSPQAEEGYLLVAEGHPRYAELALNAALSIKRLDKRPIVLCLDPALKLPPLYHAHFDDVVSSCPSPEYYGAIKKLCLYELSPFRKTMYVDTDCILFKERINHWWEKLSGQPFAMQGHIAHDGPVHQKDAETLRMATGAPFIVTMNSGVIYFEKGAVAQSVFDTANRLYLSDFRSIVGHQYRPGEWADEPYFGTAMGMTNVRPIPFTDKLDCLQALLCFSYDHYFDLDRQELYFISGSDLNSIKIISGCFAHFSDLQPRDKYMFLANRLRRDACLTPMPQG